MLPVALDWDKEPLSEAELDQALAELDEESKPWRALMQLLAVATGRAVAESIAPKLTEREAGMAAGRIEGVLLVRTELKARRERARG